MYKPLHSLLLRNPNNLSVCVRLHIHFHCFSSSLVAEDDWEGAAWGSGGGKAPSARQNKGNYREHPYGRF